MGHGFNPWSGKIPQALEQLNTALEPACPRVHAAQQEKPPQWEAHAPQLESSPHLLQLEKATYTATGTQYNPK